MAAYIDLNYYTDVYMGIAVDAAAFPRLALRSSEQVDALTFNRIGNLTAHPTDIQAAIKTATAIIAEGMAAIEQYSDVGIVTTSENASGAYSYTVDAASVKAARADMVSRAKAVLLPTGLLYAGVCR